MKYNTKHFRRTNYFKKITAITLSLLIVMMGIIISFAFIIMSVSNTTLYTTQQSTINNAHNNTDSIYSTQFTKSDTLSSVLPIENEIVEDYEVIENETIAQGEINDTVFLFPITDADPTYQSVPVSLSQSERVELSHLIMGEAGGEGFEGCCLLAQCVRDAMVYKGYTTIDEVITSMGYNGYKYETNSDVEQAIDYIFTEGNSAVQHRILVMYASNLCEGEWHETQNFIIQYNYVRFFDMWEV